MGSTTPAASAAVPTSPAAAQQAVLPAGTFGNSSLYVGDLDPAVSESQLFDLFSQVGPVLSIRVCRDQIRRASLGYAYVNYNNAHDAATALDLLNFTQINGKSIRIMFSHRDPSIRKSGLANVFIKNLDASIGNKALYDTFVTFGTILSCKVATDNNGQTKGYGFVQFEEEEAAQNAIKRLNGMLLNDKQVYVGLFVRRQERDTANVSSKFTNVYVKKYLKLSLMRTLRKILVNMARLLVQLL